MKGGIEKIKGGGEERKKKGILSNNRKANERKGWMGGWRDG